MKVLVVGAQGQLSRCLNSCAREKAQILLLGRPDVDLLAPETIAPALLRCAPDVVINAAAYTAVDRAESEPAAAFALNATGAEALARACAAHRLPLIHVSTDYVFDGKSEAPYAESDATGPLGVYGRSKLAGEVGVASANPRHIIARTSWLMSAHGHNFLKTMMRLASERDELRVVADQRGSPTYAPDLAAALLGIARQMSKAGEQDARWGVYHIANQGEASWHEVASVALAAAHACGGRRVAVQAITTAQYPSAAARPMRSVLDCRKLERRLGIVLPDWRSRIAEGAQRIARGAASVGA